MSIRKFLKRSIGIDKDLLIGSQCYKMLLETLYE